MKLVAMKFGCRSRASAVAVIGTWALSTAVALAIDMPDPTSLRQALNAPTQTIEVVEPHLTTRERTTMVEYVGWPAESALHHLFGAEWQEPGLDVEFRALDGYVSRIPAERFKEYRAYLVYARLDEHTFSVDNPGQNETGVALGPYYLVWDNVGNSELVAEGGTYWPYQITEVNLSRARIAAMLPGSMADIDADAAALTQKYCLSCHKVNGYGGDKWPIDLAVQVKGMKSADFERWVLDPSAVKPGTTMPPLSELMPEESRVALAKRLFAYLSAVAVTAD